MRPIILKHAGGIAACGSQAVLLVFLPLLSVSVRAGQSADSNQAASCLQAAKKELGPAAVVLKFGNLTGTSALGCVAGVPLKQSRNTADGTPVSSFVILRQSLSPGWKTELTGDKSWMRNDTGYLGLEFIDDSHPSAGYRIGFKDRRSDGEPGFVLYVYYLSPRAEDEGLPVEISWNPKVGRFQEFDYGIDLHGIGFRSEVKNPRHVRAQTRLP